MPSQSHEVPPVSAPFPIRRPYPKSFWRCGGRMNALLESMETGSMGSLPPAGRQMDAEEGKRIALASSSAAWTGTQPV